ncbi:hypothetical protein A8P48_19395 [Yersinia pestis]|nr:hypothetical protein A8P48_19395 [Yersinia pestis]PVU28967.1 hypothetical protein A8M58_16365 [Yersinia pestis]
MLFLVSKLVNSQAAALAAIAPMGLQLGVEPKMLIAFFPAAYGYFVLPTYPSDLACIGFDRSGTTKLVDSLSTIALSFQVLLASFAPVSRAICW